jgi:hypothetical protein
VDPLVAAVVSGLLGGGVAGAVIGGLVTLRSQHRAFDYERRSRFLDLKRERYAALLLGSDEWFRAQWHQMDVTIGRGLPTRTIIRVAMSVQPEISDAEPLLPVIWEKRIVTFYSPRHP